MKKAILIIDFGTSKVHVNLIGVEHGEMYFSESAKYELHTPAPGYAEINPYDLTDRAQECVQKIVERALPEYSISGICFSYFGDSIMALDKDRKPLTNLILAFDSRAVKQRDELSEAIGETEYRRITGGIASSDDSGAKILWLKENKPEIFKKAKYYYSNQQFVLQMLGMPPYVDVTMASRKMLFDVRQRCWSRPLLEYIGISEESLGEVTDSMKVVGTIRRFGNVDLGSDVPVVMGAHDCNCGMLGAGIDGSSSDRMADITGTWDHLGYIARQEADTEMVVKNGIMHTYCGPLKYSSVSLGAFPTSGAVLEWFMREIIGSTEKEAYDKLWNASDFETHRPEIFYPDFSSGNGRWLGLGLGTTREIMFETIIEALTFEAKNIMEICEESVGRKFAGIYIGGGAAATEKWLQLRADILGCPVVRLENLEISSIGAAVLGTVALGIYETTEQAIEQLVRVERIYHPNMDNKEFYQNKYQRYKARR